MRRASAARREAESFEKIPSEPQEPFRTAVVIRRVLVPSKPRTDDQNQIFEATPPTRETSLAEHADLVEDPSALKSLDSRPTSPKEEADARPSDKETASGPSGPSSERSDRVDPNPLGEAQSVTPEAPQAPAPPSNLSLPGEPIAFDEQGVPIIVRSVELGQSRHYVLNEDGKWHTFGDRTVDSLMKSGEDTAREWLGALSHRDVRGLVHELGQRLLKSSQLYQKQQGVLEFICDMADYAFFGLTSQCSERELDNAYRKMAKKMHPDKNGGTDMAKKRFQHMKERYESLKSRRGAGPPPPEEEDSEEPKPENDTGRIEFDPFDRKSLDQTVWKMLGQLRMLKQGLQEISQQIGQRRGATT